MKLLAMEYSYTCAFFFFFLSCCLFAPLSGASWRREDVVILTDGNIQCLT